MGGDYWITFARELAAVRAKKLEHSVQRKKKRKHKIENE